MTAPRQDGAGQDDAVAVVIPAWRAEPWIAGALDTIAGQQHAAAEVVIVEDGPSDGLAVAVEAWKAAHPGAAPTVRLLRQANAGVSAARNAGVAATTAPWIAFLDADDRWTPDHLIRGLAAARAAGADAVVAATQTIDPEGNPLPEPPRGRDLPADPVARRVAFFDCRAVPTSSGVMVKRWAFERVGGFDSALNYGEDADLWLRLEMAGARWVATGAATCLYRKHPGSVMAATARVLTGTAAFREKHLRNPGLPAGHARRALRATLWADWRIHRRSDPARARRVMARLRALEPLQPLWWLLTIWPFHSGRTG